MSYYPILKAPYCTGKTTLYNFPPNDWEGARNDKKVINLSYIDDVIEEKLKSSSK